MSGFKEIKVNVRKTVPVSWNKDEKGKDIKSEPIEFKTEWEEYGFNLYQISYWRGFVGKDENGVSGVFTQMYLAGNPKGIILYCKKEDFEQAIAEQTVGDQLASEKYRTVLATIFTDWLEQKELEDKRASEEEHKRVLKLQEENKSTEAK